MSHIDMLNTLRGETMKLALKILDCLKHLKGIESGSYLVPS